MEAISVRSRAIRQLDDWWELASTEEAPPNRCHFDPARMIGLLPNLMISEVCLNPFRIRYRLVGTRICEVAGVNFTGRYLDEILTGTMVELWTGHYRQAYQTRRPVFGEATATTTTGKDFRYEFGIFPLRVGGQDVAQFLALEDYTNLRGGLMEIFMPSSMTTFTASQPRPGA